MFKLKKKSQSCFFSINKRVCLLKKSANNQHHLFINITSHIGCYFLICFHPVSRTFWAAASAPGCQGSWVRESSSEHCRCPPYSVLYVWAGHPNPKTRLSWGLSLAKPDPDPPIQNVGWFTQGYQLHPATFTPHLNLCTVCQGLSTDIFAFIFIFYSHVIYIFPPWSSAQSCLFTSDTFYLPPP